MAKRTSVYVDGFNLYYGCIKGTPYKWLNIADLCQRLFPDNAIHRVRYFTARVRATEHDPGKPQRQDMFLRALATIPNLSIHLGHFTSHSRMMPLATPLPDGREMVEVIRTEEKGSDVNLASYLLCDAFKGDFEAAIVVSNDSDLAEPIRMVRRELNLPVGILNPQGDSHKVAWELRHAAAFYRVISEAALAVAQFPPELVDAQGAFHKPPAW